jgi:hypothetical protein
LCPRVHIDLPVIWSPPQSLTKNGKGEELWLVELCRL